MMGNSSTGVLNHCFLGLDLGQAKDFTALAIIEQQGYEEESEMHVRHLQRWPLGTAYPDIVTEMETMLLSPAFLKGLQPTLAVDGTGVGAPVVDMFRRANLYAHLRPILITGGDNVTRDGDVTRVPKRDLVGVVQSDLQSGRLKVAASLPEAPTLQRELQNFQVKININANDQYGAWREGTHDDLVLAVALALWVGRSTPWGNCYATGGIRYGQMQSEFY